MRALRGVLFDIDGTLLDTREEWACAFNAALGRAGRPPVSLEAITPWIGFPFDRILSEGFRVPPADVPRITAAFVEEEMAILARGVRAFPGVPEMLASLGPWAVAAVSNKANSAAREALRLAGVLDRFAAVVGGDQVARKKPAPDAVVRAAEVLRIPVDACAIVGDTENDVLAGKAAGARTIGVTWGYGGRRRLEASGVDHLVETPAALPPLLRALTPSTGT